MADFFVWCWEMKLRLRVVHRLQKSAPWGGWLFNCWQQASFPGDRLRGDLPQVKKKCIQKTSHVGADGI
jgi:hypothetical protein